MSESPHPYPATVNPELFARRLQTLRKVGLWGYIRELYYTSCTSPRPQSTASDTPPIETDYVELEPMSYPQSTGRALEGQIEGRAFQSLSWVYDKLI